MAIAYQSSQTATNAGSSLTITKPVGTAVGDLLIASIGTSGSISSIPTDWNLLINQSASDANLYVYYIIATSTQVAATNFTFSGAASVMAGGIARITGNFHSSPLVRNAKDNEVSTTTPSYTISVTPDDAGSLLLFFVACGSSASNTVTTSNYAVTTSNPSWSEAWDTAINTASENIQSALAYATRPEITATGNASLTISNARVSSAGMVAIRPQFSSTLTETESVTDIVTKGITKNLSETESVTETLTANKQRIWSNTSKNTTTWTNVNKT